MKTYIAIAFLGLTVSARAQNTVDFRNQVADFPTPADRYVYREHVGGVRLVGTNYAPQYSRNSMMFGDHFSRSTNNLCRKTPLS